MRILAAVACIAVSIPAHAQELPKPDIIQTLQSEAQALTNAQAHFFDALNKLVAERNSLLAELTKLKSAGADSK